MARIDEHIARLKARRYAWPIPWAIVEMMGRKEDCRLVAYLCPAGIPTCGWGETDGVTLGQRWTEEECDRRFFQQVSKFAARVEALCTVPPNENQLGAMTSLAYNIGLGAFGKSTVLKRHNAGNVEDASRAFSLWNLALDPVTGKRKALGGLTARRAIESAIYLEPPEGSPVERMPQAVASESSLARSPITAGGAVAAGGGLFETWTSLGGLADGASSTIGSVKTFAGSISGVVGVPPGAMFGVVIAVAGIAVMVWRHRQRIGGWA